ncbi:hypothetical protein H2O64_05480 [Kordia sp. YSTF-M3]|uniref:Uncharacterized protein n=1 Tax=Kordia aestuariivivens TaxID=2759037 RepID=A0ABR7Q6C0_9FLAO|nr:hypothetical protein [Kordia aestuariivivens]MBC8754112.1 hypothetical protein [Kordia aestuariivivens]
MKKKNFIKKLQLKKTQVSNFAKDQIVGGGEPIDLSLLETCIPGCGLTENCTKYRTCNNVSFNNCTANICGSDDCNPGGNSGKPSCINFSC